MYNEHYILNLSFFLIAKALLLLNYLNYYTLKFLYLLKNFENIFFMSIYLFNFNHFIIKFNISLNVLKYFFLNL